MKLWLNSNLQPHGHCQVENTNQNKIMKLTTRKRNQFLTNHLAHRLILLRTFRERQKWFKEEYDNKRHHGDLLRCAKDSALISIRLLTEAIGLKTWRDKTSNKFELIDCYHSAYKAPKPGSDDVRIEMLLTDHTTDLVTRNDLTKAQIKLLTGILKRADKELAHLTTTYNDKFNTAKKIVEAIDLVEQLFQKHLYGKIGKKGKLLPKDNPGIGWNRYFFVDAP